MTREMVECIAKSGRVVDSFLSPVMNDTELEYLIRKVKNDLNLYLTSSQNRLIQINAILVILNH